MRTIGFPSYTVVLIAAMVGCTSVPTAPVVAIEPSSPTTVDDFELLFRSRSQDPRGSDAIGYRITWSRDGEALAELDDTFRVQSRRTAKNQRWQALVTPVDTAGNEGQPSIAEVVIANTPPTAAVSIDPTIPQPGQPLLAVPVGTDVDRDELTWRYEWSQGGVVTEFVERELPGGLTSKGDIWTVRAWPFDGDDEGEPAEASVSIDNAAPVAVSVAITPADAFTDTLLTAVPEGTDEDGDALTWTYRWLVDDVIVPTALGPELTPENFGRGQRIIVEATPNDGFVDGATIRSPVLRIQNTPPTVAAAAVLPAEAFRATTLSCLGSGFADIDGDPEGYRYTWFVGETPAGSTATLDGSSFRKGDLVACDLTAFDGISEGTTVRADAVRILNTPPVLDSVAIDNAAPSAGDSVGVLRVGARDDDDDTINYRYRWLNGATLLSTDPTLPPGTLRRGMVLTVEVTPFDDEEDGEMVVSPAVTVVNTAPEMVSITVAPDPAFTNDSLTAAATATDADSDAVSLTWAWAVNGSAAGGDSPTLASSAFVRGDRVRVTVTPSDGDLSGEPLISAELEISNSIPSISSVRIDPDTDVLTGTELTCIPEGWADLDGDPETFFYAWTIAGEVVGEAATLAPADIVRGDEITCTVTPYDGSDEGDAVVSAAVTVGNTAPELGGVSLSTASPREGDTVFVTLEGPFDADDDEITFSYQWFVNDTAVSSAESLTSADFDKDDRIYVVVTPNDGFVDGDAVTSETITVQNTPPVLEPVVIAPESPFTTDTIVATTSASDVDGADSPTIRYAWYVDGTLVSGVTGASLPSARFTKNQDIYVIATASDGDDDSLPQTSGTIRSINTAPTFASVVVSPSSGVLTGDTLTCTPSGWSDDDLDTEGYRYTWFVDGATAGTSATLSTGFLRGSEIACRAVAFDGEEEGTSLTSATVTVDNSPPELASAVIAPGSPLTADRLTVTLGAITDADSDPVTLSYVWFKNGSAAGTGASLAASSTARGDEIYVVVTPNDGVDDGDAVTSSTVTVGNTAPVMSAVTLAPAAPRTLDAIVATATGTDADAADTVSFTYAWFVDDSEVGGATTATLPNTAFVKGDEVYVRVTPTDGTDTGSPLDSARLTIANTPPVVASASISPADPTSADELSCVAGAWTDPDAGDTEEYRYAWTVDGVDAGVDTSTLDVAEFDRGSRVRCTITPFDGDEEGAAVDSATLTIANSPPELDTVSITPEVPSILSTLSAVLGTTTDADGDEVTYRYTWRVGSTIVGTSATLSGSRLTKDDVVVLTVVPTDGIDDGDPVISDPVTVGNVAPTMSSVSITPSSDVRTDTLLTAVAAGADDDGDPLTYKYRWFVQTGGAGDFDEVSGETSVTLSGSFFSRDDKVQVEATANDGIDDSAPLTSASVTVINTAPSITGVSVTPSVLRTGDVATCSPTGWSDPDGDDEDYDYAWSVDGSTVGGETGETFTLSTVDAGELVRCTATPTDGIDDGTAITSDPITVSSTAPTLAGLSLTPDGPTTTQDVTAAVTPSDVDAADTTVTVTFVWSVAGVEVETDVVADVDVDTETTATLTAANYKKGELISVSVTASDGTDSSAASADSTDVTNTAPVVSSLSITPDPLTKAGGPATAVYTVTDPDVDDGVDTIVATIDWFVGEAGSELFAAAGATLSSDDYDRGDSVYFEIEVDDGDATDDGTSGAVTVGNSAPTAPEISLTPADAPASSADLVCAVTTASTDPDDDDITYSFVWRLNGVVESGGAVLGEDGDESRIPAEGVVAGDWSCTVAATDDFEPPASSAEVVASTTATTACDDGFKNGDETDEDCGGSCGPCDLGGACEVDGDCEFYCGKVEGDDICVAPSADCQALEDDGLFMGDGMYAIQPDVGLDPFEVLCADDGGTVWTRVANYRSDFELFDYDIVANQLQTSDSGGSTEGEPFDLTDTTWGHVALSLFDEGRDVRLRCKLDVDDPWFSATSSLFSDWTLGDKGDYGTSSWGNISGEGDGRQWLGTCGSVRLTGVDGALTRGIGLCSGEGASSDFTNHVVSFSFSTGGVYGGALVVGCDGDGETLGKTVDARGEVWIH